MSGSTSSSDFGHGIIDPLRLGVCEPHIEQRAQGQLCRWLPGERTELMAALRRLRGARAAGGTGQSASEARGLKRGSPKLEGAEYRGGGASHSPPKDLGERQVVGIKH